MEMNYRELEELRYAKGLLENVSFAAKVAGAIGLPFEKGLQALPAKFSDMIGQAARTALQRALEFAVKTMDKGGSRPSSDLFHKMAVVATGAGGGAFGLAGLPIELPISTAIMLRSIADVARSQGELIHVPEAKLACIQVFALGGRSRSDDGTELGYFAVRTALSRAITEAAQYIAERGLVFQGAPPVIRFIGQVASRFGVTISEKLAAQAVPVAGAAGAAFLNLIFMDHYQDMARGHFIVRRLERTYCSEIVQKAYSAV
ncbi:MAG: EcsC family protein [Desulfobacteraceae bacterium]|nr:MAG: EcsC family protein [Desulfobacteraceae bacterium]